MVALGIDCSTGQRNTIRFRHLSWESNPRSIRQRPSAFVYPGDPGVPNTLVPQRNRFARVLAWPTHRARRTEFWEDHRCPGQNKHSAPVWIFYSVIQGNTNRHRLSLSLPMARAIRTRLCCLQRPSLCGQRHSSRGIRFRYVFDR